MKVVIINKSDSTGGAAVVSRRLMEALQGAGVDARMLVAEKLSDSPDVGLIAGAMRIKVAFLADRLKIAFANGFCRRTLFQMDAAAAGIDLSRHPWVREADAVLINWINQGVLSLKGIGRIASMGKRVIWTMHDMWNMTGLCHHAGECRRFTKQEADTRRIALPKRSSAEDHDNAGIPCGECPLLGARGSAGDLSFRVARRKESLYESSEIEFVAVSRWLARKGEESALLGCRKIHVIHNAFPIPVEAVPAKKDPREELRIVMGAARLDDPVKNFPMLIEIFGQLKEKYPEMAEHLQITLFGAIKDAGLINQLREAASQAKIDYRGMLHDPAEIAGIYKDGHIVLSTSHYETLPGTLIEGQAYGCTPIALDSGGQADIITDEMSGVLIEATGSDKEKAGKFADAIREVAARYVDHPELPSLLRKSVEGKFASSVIARRYVDLIRQSASASMADGR